MTSRRMGGPGATFVTRPTAWRAGSQPSSSTRENERLYGAAVLVLSDSDRGTIPTGSSMQHAKLRIGCGNQPEQGTSRPDPLPRHAPPLEGASAIGRPRGAHATHSS